MALVNRTFMLDITPVAIPQVVKVSEYDVNRAYTVTLVDEGGVFEIPSGTTATIEGTIGGNAFSESATVSGNTITFTLSESMTAKAGDVWCKIKLTKDSKPIQTCAFILRCDKAGAEADTVIGAPGFEEQIVNAVQGWLDEHPPASGGMTEEIKQALLNLFNAVQIGWNVDNARELIAELEAALYPPVDVLSISAVFTQGDNVIYDTDSLDDLKQYLVVTATMTDSTTQTLEDSDYTLSGTLAVGISTITVSYDGKTTTFSVLVSAEYQKVEYIEATGTQMIATDIAPDSPEFSFEVGFYKASQASSSQALVASYIIGDTSGLQRFSASFRTTANKLGIYSSDWHEITSSDLYGHNAVLNVAFKTTSPYASGTLVANGQTTQISKTTANFANIGDGTINFFNVAAVGTAWASARLMYCKFYKNGAIFADFVPCYRTEDGEIGLLETISGNFYGNSGTGTFLKGGDIA